MTFERQVNSEIQQECWIAGSYGVSGGDVCGHPAGYNRSYYSLLGTASADGCEDPYGNHTQIPYTCGDVTANIPDLAMADEIAATLGLRAIHVLKDCATNYARVDTTRVATLGCWDNVGRWERTYQRAVVRCTNLEEYDMEVAIDIKFCSDPNAFNCRKKGVLLVTIFGAEVLDVADLDVSTLQLCTEDLTACTSAPRTYSIADRGDPSSDLGAAECPIVEGEEGILEEQYYLNQDGYDDLDAAFEASPNLSPRG